MILGPIIKSNAYAIRLQRYRDYKYKFFNHCTSPLQLPSLSLHLCIITWFSLYAIHWTFYRVDGRCYHYINILSILHLNPSISPPLLSPLLYPLSSSFYSISSPSFHVSHPGTCPWDAIDFSLQVPLNLIICSLVIQGSTHIYTPDLVKPKYSLGLLDSYIYSPGFLKPKYSLYIGLLGSTLITDVYLNL